MFLREREKMHTYHEVKKRTRIDIIHFISEETLCTISIAYFIMKCKYSTAFLICNLCTHIHTHSMLSMKVLLFRKEGQEHTWLL